MYINSKIFKTHAEGVMDIAFNVNDVDTIFDRAVKHGSGIIRLPKIISDSNGSVKLATISIPNTDIQHTLIENINYTGPFYLIIRIQNLNYHKISKFN